MASSLQTDEQKTTLCDLLPHYDDFILSLNSNSYSPRTIKNYSSDLEIFNTFLKAEAKISFSKIDKRLIDLYKAHLNSYARKTAKGAIGRRKITSGTINRCLTSLRVYLRYLSDMDYNPPLVPNQIKMVKTERKHPQVADLHELIDLVEFPEKYEKDTRVGTRNRAMLEVLFSTGMRISELLNLKVNQIDKTGKIFITGKGRKQRFVYLTQRAFDIIKNYLKTRIDKSDYLFIPYRGMHTSKKENVREKKISSNYLQMKIKEYREQLGINVPTSAHSLRHGFATYLAENGANPAAIQILLGHESLDTTTRYVNTSDRYAEDTHRKFHPLKK